MASKQLPIDLQVLRVIAYRMTWLLVILTFVSFAFSSLITASLINMYTASITIFVDPESVLGDIARGVAVTTSLSDQLSTLQHYIVSDDFLEPHVIQELGLRLSDVYIPPGRLRFMPSVLEYVDVLKDVVKRLFGLEIYTQTDEQERYMEGRAMIEALKQGIRLQQSRGMLLIISYDGLDSTTCRKIVEIIANQCKEFLLRTKNQETRDALRYIERQYQEANQKLADLERELADLRVEQFDKGPEAKIALLRQREDALGTQRQIQQELEILAAKKSELLEAKSKRQTELRNDPAIIAELAKIAQSQDALELDAMKKRLSTLRQTYTDEWPEVKNLRAEIAEREEAIQTKIDSDPKAEEKIFLADPVYNEYFRQIAQIESDEGSLSDQAKRLSDNIAIYEQKIKAMPEIEKSFSAIERDMDLYAGLQADLAQRRETARATMELEQSRGEYRIRIMARSFPTKPSGLSSIIVMAALCLVGPAIGGGIIFLLYYLDNSVKNTGDVAKEYNLPVIAIIPKTNFKKALRQHKRLIKRLPKHERQSVQAMESELSIKIEEPEVELFGRTMKRVPVPHIPKLSNELFMVTMLTNPESLAAEEYRRLCFNIEWGIHTSMISPCKTISVTSALPGEGKTITALNLAMTLARNHRVLLIDVNFRHPSLHHIFGIPASPGFSDLIVDNATPDLYVPEGSPALSIMQAGLSLSWPADLLGSTIMAEFVESLTHAPVFDYAVFDVPPALYLPDAPIVASKTTGVVWVIQELSTSKDVIRSALARITNPMLFGVVLNKSEQRLVPPKYMPTPSIRSRGKEKRSDRKISAADPQETA